MKSHPTAIVSPHAKIGADVRIGAYCIIEDDVVIGNGCQIESHAKIKSGTVLGENNFVWENAVVGGLPQHVTAPAPFGKVIIGDNNTFRESVTIHRSLKESEATVIGNDNYLMVNAHVAHDCTVGNNCVLVNNVMLGGHVTVGNRVNLGGATAVHQFCRIGSLVMAGGQARIIQDVPPYMTVDGLSSRIACLNLIGLRRSGKTTEEIKILKAVFRLIYRSGRPWREILAELDQHYAIGPAAELTQFLKHSKRGFVSARREASLKFVSHDDEVSENNGETPTFRAIAG